MTLKHALYGATALSFIAGAALAQATTITIATVNNGDMIRMQGLTDDFTAQHPDIALEWVTLEEKRAAPETSPPTSRPAAAPTT